MKYIVLAAAIFFFLANDLSADTVRLKNKNSINGIIAEENERSVVLNIGCGTVTLSRADIDSIEKSSEPANISMMKEWKRRYFESFPAPTETEQRLLEEFKALRYKKEQLVRSAIRRDNAAKEISGLQTEISQLQDKLLKLGEELKGADPRKDIIRYNALAIEFNSVSNKLNDTINMLNELEDNYRAFDEQSVRYVDTFLGFLEDFQRQYDKLANSSLTQQQKEFYANLKERLDMLSQDIRHEEIAFTREKESVVVMATLNGRIKTPMIVDTGASLTIISKDMARRLGIDKRELKQDLELVVADGRRIPAKFVLLDSVKVGNVAAKGVEAAIIDDTETKAVQNLLGMSFLRNFSFSINPEKKQLLLNYFEER